jgi:hypothetical protein
MQKPGPIGWAAVVAGACGLLALFLPWFTPTATANGQTSTASASFHSWNGVFLLIIGPIALIVYGVLWYQALSGRRTSARFAVSANPIRSLSIQSTIAGVVAIVVGMLAFPVFGATYRISGLSGDQTVKWTDAVSLANRAGIKLSKGPQIGLWILFIGGVLMIIVGLVGVLTKQSTDYPAAGYGPAAEYLPPPRPSAGYAPPPPPQYPQPEPYPRPETYPPQAYPPPQSYYPPPDAPPADNPPQSPQQ